MNRQTWVTCPTPMSELCELQDTIAFITRFSPEDRSHVERFFGWSGGVDKLAHALSVGCRMRTGRKRRSDVELRRPLSVHIRASRRRRSRKEGEASGRVRCEQQRDHEAAEGGALQHRQSTRQHSRIASTTSIFVTSSSLGLIISGIIKLCIIALHPWVPLPLRHFCQPLSLMSAYAVTFHSYQ